MATTKEPKAQKEDQFTTQIIALSRITIPARTRKRLKLKEQDWVEVKLKKVG